MCPGVWGTLDQGTFSFKISRKGFLGHRTFSAETGEVPGRLEQVGHSTYHLVQSLQFLGKEAKAQGSTHEVKQLVIHDTYTLFSLIYTDSFSLQIYCNFSDLIVHH